jgi:hypothetical protein
MLDLFSTPLRRFLLRSKSLSPCYKTDYSKRNKDTSHDGIRYWRIHVIILYTIIEINITDLAKNASQMIPNNDSIKQKKEKTSNSVMAVLPMSREATCMIPIYLFYYIHSKLLGHLTIHRSFTICFVIFYDQGLSNYILTVWSNFLHDMICKSFHDLVSLIL